MGWMALGPFLPTSGAYLGHFLIQNLRKSSRAITASKLCRNTHVSRIHSLIFIFNVKVIVSILLKTWYKINPLRYITPVEICTAFQVSDFIIVVPGLVASWSCSLYADMGTWLARQSCVYHPDDRYDAWAFLETGSAELLRLLMECSTKLPHEGSAAHF